MGVFGSEAGGNASKASVMVRDDVRCESRRWRSATTGKSCAAVNAALVTLVCFGAGCQGGRLTLFDPLHRAAARAEVRRGERLLVKSKTDEAAAAFRRAVSSDPRCAAAHAQLGKMSASAGDLDGATEHFRAAVKSNPDNVDYALALAEHLRAAAPTSMDPSRTLRAAIRAYRHVRSIDVAQPSAALGLAACYGSFGAQRVALETLREVRRTYRDSAALHCAIAATHTRLNEDKSALAAYGEALRIDPDCIAAHNGAGEINSRLIGAGTGVRRALARERATAHLRRSLELEAEQPRIRALLAGFSAAEWHATGPAVDAVE